MAAVAKKCFITTRVSWVFWMSQVALGGRQVGHHTASTATPNCQVGRECSHGSHVGIGRRHSRGRNFFPIWDLEAQHFVHFWREPNFWKDGTPSLQDPVSPLDNKLANSKLLGIRVLSILLWQKHQRMWFFLPSRCWDKLCHHMLSLKNFRLTHARSGICKGHHEGLIYNRWISFVRIFLRLATSTSEAPPYFDVAVLANPMIGTSNLFMPRFIIVSGDTAKQSSKSTYGKARLHGPGIMIMQMVL